MVVTELNVSLSEANRIELMQGSGLTLETIQAAGIYTERDRGTLSAMLNRKSYPASYGAALVFPYYDATGAVVLKRVKPSNPPKDNKGKPRKYLQPSDVPIRAYIPPATRTILSDATTRLVITEGEKKTLAATQAGFHCLGLSGVDCWHPKGSMALLPDLASVAWSSRPVFIAFDSDAVDNENVDRAERQLAAVLKSHGAKVRIVRIPPAENGDKLGIDDFLVARGAAEFQKLLREATEPKAPDAGDLKGNAKNCDPAIEANYILDGDKMRGFFRLRFWRGSWWWWSKGCYREIPSEEIRAQIVNSMNIRWLDVKSRHVSDVMEHLKAKAILAAAVEPARWLGKPPHNWAPDECLATRSEVIHLPSLVDCEELFSFPASPDFFTTTATEFPIDLHAPRPKEWLSLLDKLWPNDPQSIESLQEWFGYCLTSDTRQQKGLLLVGPPRSGKGTIGRIQTAIVGKGNIASPTLAGLGTNFGMWPLIGKSLAIISDARLSGRADQVAVVERFLSITGEDSITIDRKNLQPITCRLTTRFLILTNELPRFSDASGAIVSRFILLRTTESWLGREDLALEKRLLCELPGILLWAIAGWHRLRERGYFLQPDSSFEALNEMQDLASPVGAFVREQCIVGPGKVVPKETIFNAWKSWCATQGREKYVGTLASFGRDLFAVVPTAKGSRPRIEGERVQVYEGIDLLSTF